MYDLFENYIQKESIPNEILSLMVKSFDFRKVKEDLGFDAIEKNYILNYSSGHGIKVIVYAERNEICARYYRIDSSLEVEDPSEYEVFCQRIFDEDYPKLIWRIEQKVTDI